MNGAFQCQSTQLTCQKAYSGIRHTSSNERVVHRKPSPLKKQPFGSIGGTYNIIIHYLQHQIVCLVIDKQSHCIRKCCPVRLVCIEWAYIGSATQLAIPVTLDIQLVSGVSFHCSAHTDTSTHTNLFTSRATDQLP